MSGPEKGPQVLLTRKALQLSLSAPRSPPFGTVHHSVLVGNNPLDDPYADHHKELAHSDYNRHSGIRENIMHMVYNASLNHTLAHPHMLMGPEIADQVTRYLGSFLPLSWQNYIRDSGNLRSFADGVVEYAMVGGSIFFPKAAYRQLQLTKRRQELRYGGHEAQFIDMFFPDDCEEEDLQGLLFFVHGGAWGSGKPWYYRLVAQTFLDQKMAVAIVGYRVYPEAEVNAQVTDLEAAYLFLSKKYPNLCGPTRKERPIGVCAMGHSSGAHIAFLMLVEQAKRLIHIEQTRLESKNTEPQTRPLMDLFVGLSGPYDISQHFDYEAARGLEELSPLKVANGHTREQFRLNSPALRLKEFLLAFTESSQLSLNRFFPRSLLLHGIEDDVVPFTSTGEAAHVLRTCGLSKCDEYYAPLAGHFEPFTDFLFGGQVKKAVVDWLEMIQQGRESNTVPNSRL